MAKVSFNEMSHAHYVAWKIQNFKLTPLNSKQHIPNEQKNKTKVFIATCFQPPRKKSII